MLNSNGIKQVKNLNLSGIKILLIKFLGTHLLLLCSTETSANSYYGDTTLHYMNINGESQLVTLSKQLAFSS